MLYQTKRMINTRLEEVLRKNIMYKLGALTPEGIAYFTMSACIAELLEILKSTFRQKLITSFLPG